VVRTALADVDVIQFEEIPALVAGRANPLLFTQGAAPSCFVGNRLTVATKVKDFMASRCNKYRKEAERSRRRLEDAGEFAFAPPVRPCWSGSIGPTAGSRLGRPSATAKPDTTTGSTSPNLRLLYREMPVANRDNGFANFFTLTVDGQLVASLLGIT
jgi:hypothetical protein